MTARVKVLAGELGVWHLGHEALLGGVQGTIAAVSHRWSEVHRGFVVDVSYGFAADGQLGELFTLLLDPSTVCYVEPYAAVRWSGES